MSLLYSYKNLRVLEDVLRRNKLCGKSKLLRNTGQTDGLFLYVEGKFSFTFEANENNFRLLYVDPVIRKTKCKSFKTKLSFYMSLAI